MDVTVIGLVGTGIASSVAVVVRQVRLHLRDRAQLELAWHMFDQTRSTDALRGLTELQRAMVPVIILRPVLDKQSDKALPQLAASPDPPGPSDRAS